jgi:hypothetical protein
MSWSYPQLYLPADVHSKEGFHAMMVELQTHMLGQFGVSSTMVLGFGMLLAEFNRTEFRDPAESDPEMPDYVANTALGLPELDMVAELLRITV